MRRHGIDLIVLGGLSLLAGCPDRAVSAVDTGQQGAVTKEIPVSADIDILFVIDDSSSTEDKQMLFQSNFDKFVQALDAFPTGRPNLHMGVVTSTVNDGPAAAQLSPACGGGGKDGLLQEGSAVSGRYISDVAGPNGSASPRQTNYSGTLEDAFSSIASVGAGGCGFEADLEGMKRALDGTTNPQNQGFVRDGAYLAVIFLTDEDDASLKEGSDGQAVFSNTSGLSSGAINSDFRVQPLYAYNCDTPIGAGSGSAFYTNCTPRTDSYLQDPAFYSSFLAGVKDPARTVIGVVAAPPPPPFQTNDNPPQMANITYGAGANTIGTGALTISSQPQDPALLPSCSTTIGADTAIGRPAIRMQSFLSAYGDRGKFYNICQADYSNALTDIGNTLFNAISPCLEGPIDTADADTNNPGTQLQCTVNDVLNQGGSDETQTLIPTCQMANSANAGAQCNTPPCPASGTPTPCWWVDQNTTSCPAPDTGYELNIFRSQPAATGTTVDVQCAVVAQ